MGYESYKVFGEMAMKHNELLDKIYWHWRRDNSGADGLQPMVDYRRALLEVVQLHKPWAEWGTQEGWLCSECKANEIESEIYPCRTIQAIEKALDTTHLVEPIVSSSGITTTK